MREQLFRRDVMFGIFFILPRAEKILDVERAPINEIGHRSVRVNEMVNAPAEFSGNSLHGIKLRVKDCNALKHWRQTELDALPHGQHFLTVVAAVSSVTIVNFTKLLEKICCA